MFSGPDALAEGTILADSYRVGRRLGQGGMGTVYEATLERLGRLVAIKVLDPSLATDEVHLERFRREAVAAASLGHPNIVGVFDFHRSDGCVFFAMELLRGEALHRLVRREGRLAPARAVRIITQVLSGLRAAHEAGVVHRDLKPPNVFVIPVAGGVELVKILDFGVAKLGEAKGERLTLDGTAVGTPHFFSPEQARGEDVDGRADLFATGVLLHLLLTGQHPFHALEVGSIVKRIVAEAPDPVRVPEVPDALAGVVRRALKKRRRDRYQTAEEFADALAPFLGGEDLRAPAEAQRPGGRKHAARPQRGPLLLAALLGASATLMSAAVFAGVYVLLAALSASSPTPPSPAPPVPTGAGAREVPMLPATR